MRKPFSLWFLVIFMIVICPHAQAEITVCRPHSGDYNTGTTTFQEKTRASEIAAWFQEDGWAKFDVSAIPDGSLVQNIEFHYHVNETTGSPSWGINPVTLDPVTADAFLLAGDINGEPFGTGYAYRHETGHSAGWYMTGLGGFANYDLAGCLEQDWFAIGIRRNVDYLVLDGWAETNVPYITVTHTPAVVWYVDDDAPGDPGPGDPAVSDPQEDGSAEHPFDSIQEALDASQNGAQNTDTVLVADGTYSGDGNRDLDFGGKAVRLVSAGGTARCLITCGGSEAEHHRGFIFQNDEFVDSVVEGFTITGGYAFEGGAILCEYNARPLITGNVITGNTAEGIEGHVAGGGGICARSAARIVGNTVSGNSVILDGYGGGLHCGPGTIIADNLITGNTIIGDYGSGGGISCRYDGDVVISGNVITDNTCTGFGGGIYAPYETVITDNVIVGNSANTGGGLRSSRTSDIINNLISNNESIYSGGGVSCSGYVERLYFGNCTITNNTAGTEGGGFNCDYGVRPTIENCILWGNSAPTAPEILLGDTLYDSELTIRYSDVQGGQDSMVVDPDAILNWGPGMIDADPLFVAGPWGGWYLSQFAAGQDENSPCANTGSDDAEELTFTVDIDPRSEDPVEAGFDQFTTRTDQVTDEVRVDMGYHYTPRFEPTVTPLIVTGPGPARTNPPRVRVLDYENAPQFRYEFDAYGVPRYGVNVACGDVDGDGIDEILTGAGPGAVFGPHVRGWDVDGAPLPGLSFLAYGTNRWGVNVASGDIDGDGIHEIITGAGPGAVFGPHVRGFAYDPLAQTVSAMPEVSYFAYGTHRWGVNVTTGDIDGDGMDEIITGAGPGAVFGPHVRGWNVDGDTAAAMPEVSFLAYGTNRYGVFVGTGDVDGDGIDEIITAPGPSPAFGAQIRGWNYDAEEVAPLEGFNVFAWMPSEATYGARVGSGADLDGDGREEILVGAGPDPMVATPLKIYSYIYYTAIERTEYEVYPEEMQQGVNASAGWFEGTVE